jgi:endoglucanase
MGLDIKLMAQLAEVSGVSGEESAVRKLIRQRIEPLADSVRTDALGNLIAFKQGISQSRRRKMVMLAAHMDEVGLMVTHIDKSGYLRFAKVGGIDDRLLPAKRVLVGKNRLPGVIGIWPVHFLRRRTDREKSPSAEELAIDIGASSPEEAQSLVAVGDRACFDTRAECHGGVIKAKALDDRIGCYLLIELLKGRYPFDLTAAFTVQEEVGLRGASVVAFQPKPDLAFILEGTGAADFPQPQGSGQGRVPAMGGGPVLTLMDRSVFCDRALVKHLEGTARRLRMPYQIKRPGIGGTDAGRIHLAQGGVRTAVAAVACRYIHSPAGLASLKDISRTMQLMKAALKRLPKNILP